MHIVALCESCENPDACAARFRTRADELDLEVTLDSTLSRFPGSVHLHLRKRGEKAGTLEYTMDPGSGRAWMSFHANRAKPWVNDSIGHLLGYGCIEMAATPRSSERE